VFVDHDLRIAAFWANLTALLRSASTRLSRWLPERELRARKSRVQDSQTGWWLPVLPDAIFEVRYPDGFVQGCFLEVDLGTLTLRRFRRKVRAFELYRRIVADAIPGKSSPRAHRWTPEERRFRFPNPRVIWWPLVQ
jgi:hypothetical protein